jgi:hypothetical protein
MLHLKTLLQQLETFGPLCPVVPSIMFVLTGIAARDVDHELGEPGGIAGALAVACRAIMVPPREKTTSLLVGGSLSDRRRSYRGRWDRPPE